MNKWDSLKPFHQDFLREMGNIGTGHAATSLSQMLNKKIGMEVPEISMCGVGELCRIIGDEEELVSCVSLEVTGDVSMDMIFLLKYESALSLINNLMGLPSCTFKEMDSMMQSVLNEVGNILIGSFLNAMNSLTGLDARPSVPAYANDMLGAVLSAALLERGFYDDEVLVIGTRFYDNEVAIDGHLFMLPQYNVLEKIFKSVGIDS